MSETINCIFIPPDLTLNDIMTIIIFNDENIKEEKKNIYLIFNNKTFDLGLNEINELKYIWNLDNIEELNDIKFFQLKIDDQIYDFNLEELIFLGPINNLSIINNIPILEFTSGYYCRNIDYNSDTVSFTVDSVLTLDYRNVNSIKNQLEELSLAQQKFEETKQSLLNSGIDLNQLENLKEEYEKNLKLKRKVQYEFMIQNNKMAASTINSQTQQDQQIAIETLKRHIEINRQKVEIQESSIDSYKRLLKFRESALNELKIIFPFDIDHKKIFTLTYTNNPITIHNWNENRAFLGFITHYIREVSRILGIPLQYLLVPLAVSSYTICRLTDEKKNIPIEFNPQNKILMNQFENVLISCAIHLIKTLQMEIPNNNDIIDYIKILYQINKNCLNTLIPENFKEDE